MGLKIIVLSFMIRLARLVLFALGIAAAATAYADPQIGQLAPKIDTELIGGKLLKSSDLKGKVVLVVFWATWCPTCVNEMPILQRLYNVYKDKGVEILALSMDMDKGDAADFWKSKEYTYPLAMRLGAVKQVWGPVRATPQIFLVDRNSIIQLKHMGPITYEQLEAQINPLL